MFKDFSDKLTSMFTIDEDAMMQRMRKLADKYIEIQRANIRKD